LKNLTNRPIKGVVSSIEFQSILGAAVSWVISVQVMSGIFGLHNLFPLSVWQKIPSSVFGVGFLQYLWPANDGTFSTTSPDQTLQDMPFAAVV
jgi:hypothetical protein